MRRMGGGSPRPVEDVYGRSRGPRRLTALGLLLGVLAVGIAAGAVGERLSTPAPPASSHPTTVGVTGVGPTKTVQGIPVGYPHTPQGAAEAVGNYLAALGGRLALNPTADRAALDQVADPSTRSQLESGLAASLQVENGLWGMQTAAQQGKRVVLTQTPIAYRMASYTGQAAHVAVWLVTNVGVDSQQRLAAFFANGGATVVWLHGDWRLRQIDNGTQAGDVVPACLQTPTQTGGVPPNLDGFVPYGS